jgi:beta-N-acetylhexosaminidase
MKPYFFIGVENTTLSSQDIKNLMHPAVAGAILFTRNYENKQQLKELCQAIHQLKPSYPLKIAVDHEGGRVQRFIEQFTKIPSAKYFSQDKPFNLQQAKKEVEKYSSIASKELAECGIDINFSPCLDLDWGNSEIMNTRCYHHNPDIVAELSMAFMQAHHHNGVMSVAKHFPGHGFVAPDSHLELPVDNRPYEEIATDIKAFQKALPYTQAIMMAHIVFPQVDDDIASFSTHWMKTILRQQLGFKGIIFSDDLQMKACNQIGDGLARVEKALSAGNDYLIWGNDLPLLSELLENI